MSQGSRGALCSSSPPYHGQLIYGRLKVVPSTKGTFCGDSSSLEALRPSHESVSLHRVVGSSDALKDGMSKDPVSSRLLRSCMFLSAAGMFRQV
jgi:hypothetical protein